MNIHWFPGHMTKSLRMMDENVALMDMLIYILDARAPLACVNPVFSGYTEKLPVIYVLNKCDLANPEETEKWKKYFTSDKSVAVCLNSTQNGSSKTIFGLAKDMCKPIIEKKAAKGVRAVLRSMVIGVPNCGKSTFINNLCGKSKAIAGNKAGVTRGKQWVRANEYFEVLDTPGTLYPKFENQTFARHLAYIGSIRDEIVDTNELALEFIGEMTQKFPGYLSGRYGVEECEDSVYMLTSIAVKRGLVRKGGIAYEERASIAIIDDFRKGRMGKITLEKCYENDRVV